MAYIDLEYLGNLTTEGQLSGALHYGGTPTASTGSVAQQYIDGASSYVDSFLGPAGYDVPISSPPDILKEITGYKALEGILIRANRQIDTTLQSRLDHNTGYLIQLQNGAIRLPGITGSVAASPGGSKVYSTSGSVEFWDMLKGSYS